MDAPDQGAERRTRQWRGLENKELSASDYEVAGILGVALA